MAARDRTWTPEKVKARIRVGMLVRVLQDHVLGKRKMGATQIQAAQILLRKVLPDTQASTVTLDVREHVLTYGNYLSQAPTVPREPEATVQ